MYIIASIKWFYVSSFLPALLERKKMEFQEKGLEPDADWKNEWFQVKKGIVITLLLPCVYITVT